MELNLNDESWKDIWRNGRSASPEEKWKWDYATWEPIWEKVWAGDIDHLICPVCGQEDVYFRFLAVFEKEIEGERIIAAERWVGCNHCGVQSHNRGLLPSWVEDPEWVPGAEQNRD